MREAFRCGLACAALWALPACNGIVNVACTGRGGRLAGARRPSKRDSRSGFEYGCNLGTAGAVA